MLGGLVATWLFVGCGPGEPSTEVERFAEALEALQGEQPQLAEQLFASMVAQAPADPIARSGLARALAHQGRYGEAIVQDKLALAADPRLPEVSYNIACSYAALGELEDSLRWLSRAYDGGIRDRNLIEQDPDLDPLRQDHRFAFFLATGALSLSEREAHLRITPALVSPGQTVEVQLVVVSASCRRGSSSP
jgi:tetratricopeptide (TPR) repeat protein